jgi:hypothetical protein
LTTTHHVFGKFGQLVLKDLPWRAHDGPQIDALQAGVLLLDLPQVIDKLLGRPAQPGLLRDRGLEGGQGDARVAVRRGHRRDLLRAQAH